MRYFEFDHEVFRKRQKSLKQSADGSAIIMPAHSEHIRNFDVHHPYRQDSNLYYLTGFEEPESVLVLRMLA